MSAKENKENALSRGSLILAERKSKWKVFPFFFPFFLFSFFFEEQLDNGNIRGVVRDDDEIQSSCENKNRSADAN